MLSEAGYSARILSFRQVFDVVFREVKVCSLRIQTAISIIDFSARILKKHSSNRPKYIPKQRKVPEKLSKMGPIL